MSKLAKLDWTRARWGGWIANDPVPMTNDRVLRIREVRLLSGRIGYQLRALDPIHTAGLLNPTFTTLAQAKRATMIAIASAQLKLATTGRANRGRSH
jgi:hypothetical protein